jgi:hypothetical protein
MELFEYWRSHPPVHLMVAAYLGIKPQEKAAASSPEQIDSFVKSWGGSTMHPDNLPEWVQASIAMTEPNA